jgi:integrase
LARQGNVNSQCRLLDGLVGAGVLHHQIEPGRFFCIAAKYAEAFTKKALSSPDRPLACATVVVRPVRSLPGVSPRGLRRRPKAVVWTPERVEHWQRTGQVPSSVMVWTPEQTGRFLDHAVHDRLYPLFHLVAHRGLRRGEACGLRWIDTHLAAGTVEVLNQIVQWGWRTGQTPPKTDESAATVALDAGTVAVLAEHKARQRTERLAVGEGWVESGLVFTEPDGAPLHPAEVTERFQFLARRAGLPPIRLHDLRHGAATMALAAGVEMKVVQAMLRHASESTTSMFYTSVLPEVARAAAEKTALIIPRSSSGTLGLPSGSPETTVDSEDDQTRLPGNTKPQVNMDVDLRCECAPPGTRTPNPLVKRARQIRCTVSGCTTSCRRVSVLSDSSWARTCQLLSDRSPA